MGRSYALAVAALAAGASAQIDITTTASSNWKIVETSYANCQLTPTIVISGCPAAPVVPNSALAGGWAAAPAGVSWLGNPGTTGLGANQLRNTYALDVGAMTTAQAACAFLDATVAADDTGSFAVNGVYIPGGGTATTGIGSYNAYTTLPTASVGANFQTAANILTMTNHNTGGGAGGISVSGRINFACQPSPPPAPGPPPPPSPPPPSPSPPPPYPPPPSPPSPPGAVPPPAAVTTTTATRDPHLAFAHGGRADMKGEHNTWYNMLSAKNTSVNVLFEHADFHNPYRLVHGSKMSKLGMAVKTALTGQLVQIGFNASATGVVRARVVTPAGEQWLSHGSKQLEIENVKLHMEEKKLAGLGHGMALTISTGRWEVQAWSKPFPNRAANPGKAMLNVAISAQYDADHDVVAPHGLIGQSYDGDGIAVDGATDDYTGKEVTTKAMAEGAIEGLASDYKMAGPFATDFKYTRFSATSAQPRDVSQLKGKKKAAAKAGFGQAGASPDVDA